MINIKTQSNEDVYAGGHLVFTDNIDIKLLDKTIATLEILTKYYDSVPSELIVELIKMNKTGLVVK